MEDTSPQIQIISLIKELKDTAQFYLERYRFDPFQIREHEEQIKKLDKLLKQLKEND